MFEKTGGEVTGAGGSETIVGVSVKLKGNLKSDGNILIDGSVSGDLRTSGSVVIGETANVVASVKAGDVIVSGSVQGNIEAKDKIEITKTGRVLGDIVANVLSIAPGAVFSGKSTMNDVHHKTENVKPTAELEEPKEEKK